MQLLYAVLCLGVIATSAEEDCLAEEKRLAEQPWVDKRPENSAALVTYLNKWGDKVLKAADVSMRSRVLSCQENNIKYKTEQACKDAHEDCCFACNDKFDCGGDRPMVSTCTNNEPSPFMKKYGMKSCNTGGGIQFSTQTNWYVYIYVVTRASDCSQSVSRVVTNMYFKFIQKNNSQTPNEYKSRSRHTAR